MSRIVLNPEQAHMEIYWHHAPQDVQVIDFTQPAHAVGSRGILRAQRLWAT